MTANFTVTASHRTSKSANSHHMKSQHSSTIAMQDEQAASRARIDDDENMDDDDDDAMSNDNGTYCTTFADTIYLQYKPADPYANM